MNAVHPALVWSELMLGQTQPEAGAAPAAAPQTGGSAFDAGAPVRGVDSRPIGAAPGGGGAQPAPGAGGFPGGMIWMILLFFVVMILMQTMTGRKDKKRREALLSAIKRGDRVQTLGGIIGSVVDLTPTEVLLRVDEVSNTRIRFARSAIQQVLSEGKERGRENGTAIEAKGKGEPASV